MFDYGLGKNKIAYVKHEGSNWNTMITTLKSIVRCENLGLDESFQGTCFCFALSKLISMLQLMKTLDLFPSTLPS
jgi:hypothetical protein